MKKIIEEMDSLLVINSLLGYSFDFNHTHSFNKLQLMSREKLFIIVKKRIFSKKVEVIIRINQPWSLFTFGLDKGIISEINRFKEKNYRFKHYNSKKYNGMMNKIVFKNDDECIEFLSFIFDYIHERKERMF